MQTDSKFLRDLASEIKSLPPEHGFAPSYSERLERIADTIQRTADRILSEANASEARNMDNWLRHRRHDPATNGPADIGDTSLGEPQLCTLGKPQDTDLMQDAVAADVLCWLADRVRGWSK